MDRVSDRGVQVVVWFDKSGVWLVSFGDCVKRAKWVSLRDAVTDYKADGFSEYQPGGPRGVVRGELVAYDPVEEQT